GRLPGGPAIAEQRCLAGIALRLAELRLAEDRVQGRGELRAVSREMVHGARGDQRFDHPLVADPEIHPVAEIGERAIWPGRAARLENRFDRPAAHVSHRAQAEANFPVAGDRELPPRLIHRWWQHVDPQLASLIDVLD